MSTLPFVSENRFVHVIFYSVLISLFKCRLYFVIDYFSLYSVSGDLVEVCVLLVEIFIISTDSICVYIKSILFRIFALVTMDYF